MDILFYFCLSAKVTDCFGPDKRECINILYQTHVWRRILWGEETVRDSRYWGYGGYTMETIVPNRDDVCANL